MDEENKPIQKNNAPKKEQPKDDKDKSKYPSWGVGMAIAIIAIIVVALAGGALIDHAMNQNRFQIRTVGNGGFITRTNFSTGFASSGYVSSSNSANISGVVTAVNGTSFTVAGNGATNTVQTNSNTQYVNASKVAVNDSVVISGSINNGTFTASQVVVNP